MSIIVSEHGDWDQSWENFKPEEVQCQHCGELKIDVGIMNLLQQARNDLGPLSITSGYRCSEHNNKISSRMSSSFSVVIQTIVSIFFNLFKLLIWYSIIVVLSNGKIIASGSPQEIINDTHARSVYFGNEFKIN